MKRLLISFLVLAGTLPAAFAQVQSRSYQTTVGDFTGTMTYSFRQDGDREIPEGRKTFTAKSGEDTYQIEANYKNGLLDGAASARLHRSYTASGYDAGALHVWKAAVDVTLTARFYEGELSGLVTCNYTPSGSPKAGLADMNKQSFSANYANGHISGNYSYLSYGYPQKIVVNGTTAADGRPYGKWQIYYPQVDELMVIPYEKGSELTDLTSSVRNCIEGKITERKLFDDYGYVACEETVSFTLAAEYFDYITGTWLKGYRTVIPYEFGVKTWSGDVVLEVQPLHQMTVIRYLGLPSFTNSGFERFKKRYFESICGGKPLEGMALKTEGKSTYVEIQPGYESAWLPDIRNMVSGASGAPSRIGLASYQAEELADEEAIDAVRRHFARTGEVLLEGNSPYKVLLTTQKMPSDLVADVRGAEAIAASCTEIRNYLTSVRNSLSSLRKTADGKFFIKDGVYYQNPGWDLNLMIADADRIITGCKDAARLYDLGSEYVASRPEVAASFKDLCGKITTGTYEDVIGTTPDAAYFAEQVVTPDVLGKVATRDEMRVALTEKSYNHFISVYPTTPAVAFRNRAGVDDFVTKSREYAGFQRSLIEFDSLVAEIRRQKTELDAELSAARTYKPMAASINQKLVEYNLQPSFRDVAEYALAKSSLENCLAFILDARDYLVVHRQYQEESGSLRDQLSAAKTSHISKFYRNLTKDFNVQWDSSLPAGRCSSNVREALGVTRRIAAVLARPDAAERDRALKGLSDAAEIWNILEAR